jgi:glutamine amidotransferase
MIIVIDYNVGNVQSVCNAFRHIGCEAMLSDDAQRIREAAGLVLPGVAAFGYAMRALGPLAGLLRETAESGKPLLGICVGHQLLFENSSEHGEHAGLGLVNGGVVPLPEAQRVPHMGWNLVEFDGENELFESLGRAKHFYFAHSYYADIKDGQAKVFYTDYGFELPCAVKKGNIYGVQFHPEKSGPQGLKVLENFAGMCEKY